MKYKVKLNGKIYEVEVEKGNAELLSEYDAISAPTPAPAPVVPATAPATTPAVVSSASGNAITSPLPGTIIDYKVSVGSKVKRGDLVLIIEAMKMENEVTAPKDGTITAIIAGKGAKVEQGTPIYELN